MNPSICLLSCLLLAQGSERAEYQLTPQLAAGLELLYRGEFLEEDLGQNYQRQTRYRLETSMLVLEAGVKERQVAFLTTLRLDDGRDPKNPLIPKTQGYDGPSSLRLELAKVDELEGRIRGLDKRLMQIPLQGPAMLEHGFLVPAPLTKVGRNHSWDVPEEGRPLMRWQVVGTETCGGVACVKLVGVQQTEDWERGRADQVAWRRRDVIWLRPQLNVAQKVERVIERRDPARNYPTERVSVHYELDSHLKYPHLGFHERRDEMLKASEMYDLTQKLIRQPAQDRRKIDIQIQALALHLDKTQATPYRHVFVHLKSVLENAKKTETPVPHTVEAPMQVPIRGVGIGQRAPDFLLSALTQEQPTQFRAKNGKPTLVLFYNPATRTGLQMIHYAKKLSDRPGPPVTILAMAVASDADAVRRQHANMRLMFPIHDGNAMRLTFGVEQTPRLVVIDSDGLITFTQTGWGLCTPEELDEILEGCQKKVAAH